MKRINLAHLFVGKKSWFMKKKKLRDMHQCTGYVRCCIDFRFWPAVLEHVERHHFKRGDYDLNPHAGGVKSILAQATEEGVENMLISCRLHTMRKIVLVAHEDCGAYRGVKSFESHEDERTFHIGQLKTAKAVIEKVLQTSGNGCYDGTDPNKEIEYIFLYAHLSPDGSEVLIEDVTNK